MGARGERDGLGARLTDKLGGAALGACGTEGKAELCQDRAHVACTIVDLLPVDAAHAHHEIGGQAQRERLRRVEHHVTVIGGTPSQSKGMHGGASTGAVSG